jgi:DNA-binding LacI/PurR family transcriptional regulator
MKRRSPTVVSLPDSAIKDETGRRPTIRDVARAAGVAVSTVSYVINRSGQVSAETQLRVNSAINALRYEPNLLARRSQRSTGKIITVKCCARGDSMASSSSAAVVC